MCIKNKFVNLDALYIDNQFGVFWSPISDLELNAIIDYLFSLQTFGVSPTFRVTTNIRLFHQKSKQD